jgi:hypothetical protein
VRAVLLAVALAAGCTVEREAFRSSPDAAPPITTCAAAYLAPEGALCAMPDACFRPGLNDPLCCQDIVFCGGGQLVHETKCDPLCSKCGFDADCPFAKAICDLGRCVACPDPGACAACPAGWTTLQRNGCPTCDCAPPSQCGPDGSCPGDQKCYVGAVCVPGCIPGYDCCANVCAGVNPPCSMPAPLGCNMKCPVELGCGLCAAASCFCEQGSWTCKPQCADVPTKCFLP